MVIGIAPNTDNKPKCPTWGIGQGGALVLMMAAKNNTKELLL